MALRVNLRHLAVREVALQGELSVAELELDSRDAMIQANRPLKYDLVVEKINENLLVRGRLQMVLDCRCVRCLEPFQHTLDLNGGLCELPLQGEDAAAAVNDCVDLTPYLCEDIFLWFPPHPLCKPECRGLSTKSPTLLQTPGTVGSGEQALSAWAELDKLKV